jgi:glycine/D-amino acid oxidase-like deaminating enzyme
MSDNVTGKQADVVVLGAGIVGVSAATAARQQGLSVVLVDRREPGSETSYGNAGILSSGSILPLNKPSLWSALPTYIANRHAALRWARPLPCQCDAGSYQTAGNGPARADRRIVETAPGMDRQGQCGAAHP